MGQLMEFGNVGLWLLLMAPGIAMLIWLVVHLLRIDVKQHRVVDPPVVGEARAVEQLGGALAALGSALADVPAPHQKNVASTRLPVPKRSIAVAPDFIKLADKMHQLAELATHVLEKRRLLAGSAMPPPLIDDGPIAARPYLSFSLDEAQFAISIFNVHSVVEASGLFTNKPSTLKLRGAIRVGSTLVPVIGLGSQLAGRPVKVSHSSCVIVLELDSGDRMKMIGVVVDAVGGVLRITPSQIEPPANPDSKIHNDFILGTAVINHYLFTLLDIERGLSANEFVMPCSVTQAQAQEGVPT